MPVTRFLDPPCKIVSLWTPLKTKTVLSIVVGIDNQWWILSITNSRNARSKRTSPDYETFHVRNLFYMFVNINKIAYYCTRCLEATSSFTHNCYVSTVLSRECNGIQSPMNVEGMSCGQGLWFNYG
jgi:hypothetical protein